MGSGAFSRFAVTPATSPHSARRRSARTRRWRDFRTAVLLNAGLWLVCEIIVDIGAVHEMSSGLLGAAATLGALGFSFALGLLLGALVCRLLRRKQLA